MIVIDDTFVRQYQGLIARQIAKTGVTDWGELNDIMSDVFIRITENNNYDESKGAVTTWLTYVTRSVLGNHFRKKVQDPLLNATDTVGYYQEISGSHL